MNPTYKTYKLVFIFTFLFFLGCKYDIEEYETMCVDADTSVENDIDEQGLLWSLSIKDLKRIISLSKRETSRNIYLLNSITTCEISFTNVTIDNKQCNVTLNAGSYGGVICTDDSKYGFGCYEDECKPYFPFPFEGYE